MTEQKRTGRPSKIEGATQDLAHRELLDQKCAQLGILMDKVTDGEIADDDAETELSKITGELKDFEFEPLKTGKNIAAPNTERLKLLDSLAKLQRRSDGEKAIAHWISNVISETDLEITRVKRQLLHSVKDQPKVVSYQHKLLQKLAVAGITKHNASQISVLGLRAMMDEGSAKPSRSTKQPKEVIEPDNFSVWINFLTKGQQHYLITEVPISSVNNPAEVHNLKDGDYPPYTDLAKYGQPKLLKEFLAAQLLKDKKKLVSEICRLWLVESYGKSTSSQLWATKKNTWSFLLALKYNFAHEIPDMKRVMLPGPEPHKTFLLAKRL